MLQPAPDSQRAIAAQTFRDALLVMSARDRITHAVERLLDAPLDAQAAAHLLDQLRCSDTRTARAALHRLREVGKGDGGAGAVAPSGATVRPLRRSA